MQIALLVSASSHFYLHDHISHLALTTANSTTPSTLNYLYQCTATTLATSTTGTALLTNNATISAMVCPRTVTDQIDIMKKCATDRKHQQTYVFIDIQHKQMNGVNGLTEHLFA